MNKSNLRCIIMNISVGVATVGFGGRTSFCDKCDVIFCYIYTNTTKLVFYLFYLRQINEYLNLIRLDCFSNAFIQECGSSRIFFVSASSSA